MNINDITNIILKRIVFQQQFADRFLEISIMMLAKLNELNSVGHRLKHGQLKVPYTKFYVSGLSHKLDLRGDYLRWARGDRVRIVILSV